MLDYHKRSSGRHGRANQELFTERSLPREEQNSCRGTYQAVGRRAGKKRAVENFRFIKERHRWRRSGFSREGHKVSARNSDWAPKTARDKFGGERLPWTSDANKTEQNDRETRNWREHREPQVHARDKQFLLEQQRLEEEDETAWVPGRAVEATLECWSGRLEWWSLENKLVRKPNKMHSNWESSRDGSTSERRRIYGGKEKSRTKNVLRV